METLSQMLEDYSSGERGLPSYEELMGLTATQGEPLLYAALNLQGNIVYSHESYANVDMNRRYIKTPTTIVGLIAIAAKETSC